MSIISALPPAPSRSDPATFSDKADALLGALDGFVSETNTVAGEVVTNKDSSATSAATATTQAGIATTQASNASTSASTATTQAGIATTAASTATTQAGIATTAASTATTQAGIATAAAASINLASPAAIGNVTPNTGAFTTLSATASGVTNPVLVSQVSNTPTYGALHFGTGYASNTMMGVYGLQSDKMYYNVPTGSAHRVSVAGTSVVDITSTGLAVTGAVSTTATADQAQLSIRRTGATNNPGMNMFANETGNIVGWDTAYSGVGPSYSWNFAGTEFMRLDTAGVLSLTQGQIKFPATQVPSADPNTLDDYEEGTWTPVIVGSTLAGTGTYATQNGQYTKIGRQVICVATINWSAHTGTGNMLLSGLPFTVLAGLLPISSQSCANMTITGQLTLELNAGAATGNFYAVVDGTLSGLALDTSAQIYLQFTYNV